MSELNEKNEVGKPYKLFPIILKENEAMALQKLVVLEQNSSSKPITSDDCTICEHLSEKQQLAIQNKIQQINSFYDSYGGELDKDNCDDEKEKALQTTCKFKKPISIESFLPSFLLGAETLSDQNCFYYDQVTLASQSENQMIVANEQIFGEIEKQIREITYCLIYDGESKDELAETIRNLDQQQLKSSSEKEASKYSKSIFVFVCGETKFQTIFSKSLKQEEIDEINKFIHHYKTSENFGYFIEKQDFPFIMNNDAANDSPSSKQFLSSNDLIPVYFVILPSLLDRVSLQRWILQGVTKFIDPTYVIVCNSNQEFKNTFLQDCLRRIHNKTDYFGLQWKKSFRSANLCSTELCILNNDNTISNDSFFAVKKFHDPLHCVYKWQSISYLIEKYFMELQNRKQFDDSCYGLNSIFTSLIYNSQGLKLFYLSEPISIINKNLDLQSITTDIGEKYYQIQKSLRKPLALQRNNRSQSLSDCLGLFIQYMLSKMMYLKNYFTLSIMLFFSFHSPYQLLKTVLDSKTGYIALSFILPALYTLTFTFLLLLAQLYVINTRKRVLYFREHNQNQLRYYKLVESENVDEQQLQAERQGYQVYVEEIPSHIENQFKCLFFIISLLDIFILAFTIINLIINYGYQLMNFRYRLAVLIFAIIQFLILVYEGWLTGFFKPTRLILFSKYYIYCNKNYSAEIKIRKKKGLALELLFNSIAFFIFILIESGFDFSGYVLLTLLVAIILLQTIEYFMVIIGKVVNYLQAKDTKIIFEINNQGLLLKTNKMNEKFEGIVKKIKNYKDKKWEKILEDEANWKKIQEDEKKRQEESKQNYKTKQKETKDSILEKINSRLSGVNA